MSNSGTTAYPTGLDSYDPIGTATYEDDTGYDQLTIHNQIQYAVEAIEAKVGINSSAVTTSHDYKLSGVTGTDKAVSKTGTENLENKTIESPYLVGTPILDSDSVVPFYNDSLHRQAIINGNFDVWQRGTSFTPANLDFLADRWQSNYNADSGTLPTDTFTRQVQTAGALFGSFFFLRLAVDGAGSGFGTGAHYDIRHKIENGTRLLCGDGKKVTISFYAKSDIANKKLGFYLTQAYGSGGSPTTAEVINGDAVTLTSSWAKYTHTFTTNTLASKTFGTAYDDFLALHLCYMWSTVRDAYVGETTAEDFVGSGNIDIAQVQLCAGDVALPFMPKSYAEELRACQRYCFKKTTGTYEHVAEGWASQTTSAYLSLFVPVTMRTTPTLTATAGDWQIADEANAGIDVTVLALAYWCENHGVLTATVASGATQYRPYALRADNNARTLILSAEL